MINYKPNVLQNSKRQMSRTDQLQSSQKDSVISSLKKELYELRDKEHEFIPLENEVTNIESKYDMLLDQKERIESEHKMKLEINRKNILELRTENDSVRMQIHKSTVQIEEVIREISNLKRTCENKENEIAALLSNHQDLNSKNQSLGQEHRSKVMKIRNHKEERNMLELQNERLLKSVEDNVELLKTLQKQGRSLEAANIKLNSILAMAERDNSDLIEEMRSRGDVVNATCKKLDTLNQDIDALRDKALRLQKECLQSEIDYAQTNKSLTSMVGQNKEQAKKIKVFQNNFRLLQNDYDTSILERDELCNEHQDLSTENKILNDQIDRALMEIMEAERMNGQLQKQLDNYRALDQEARKMMNRGQKMEELMVSTNQRLQITGNTIAHLR